MNECLLFPRRTVVKANYTVVITVGEYERLASSQFQDLEPSQKKKLLPGQGDVMRPEFELSLGVYWASFLICAVSGT